MQCLVKVISLWKPSALRWSSNWPASTDIHLNKATSLRPCKMERHKKAKKAKKASTGILKKREPPSPVTADIIVVVVKKVSLGIFFSLTPLYVSLFRWMAIDFFLSSWKQFLVLTQRNTWTDMTTWAKDKLLLVWPQAAQTYKSLLVLEAKLCDKDLYGNLS